MEEDPDVWLRVLSWLAIALSIAQVLVFSFGQDQGAYATVARGLLEGRIPYRDLWSPHPPGIFFVFAAAFSLFGENMAAPRLLEALCLVGIVLSCRRLGGVFFGSRTGGLLGGATACVVHAQTDFWHTAQPGTFGGALALFAFVVTTHPWPRRRLRWAVLLAGALLGIAGTLEPTLGIIALPLAGYLLLGRRRDGYLLPRQVGPPLLLCLGAALPWLFVLAWFMAHEALGDLGYAVWAFQFKSVAAWGEQSAPHLLYQALEKALFEQSALVAAGLIAAIAVHPRAQREKQGLFLIATILAVDLAGVAFRGSFEPRDFAAALPFLSLIAGSGLYKVWRRIGPGSLPGTLAFIALLLVLPLMRGPGRDLPQSSWERTRLRMTYLLGAGRVLGREELDRQLDHIGAFNLQSARAASRFLQERVPNGAALRVHGTEPLLYYLSGLLPEDRLVVPPSADHAAVAESTSTSTSPAAPPTPSPVVISPQHPLDLDQRRALGRHLGPPTEVEGYLIFIPRAPSD